MADPLDLLADDDEDSLDLLAGTDIGNAPVAVEEDQPGWDWLRENSPGLFNFGHEVGSGIAEGVGNLPNAIPNVVNKVNDLYHQHTDEPGTPPIEPVMDQWMTGTGLNDKSLAEMNPQTPGWEKYRDYGRMTGGALPAGPVAALAVPALAKAGSGVGAIFDYLGGDPNADGQTIYDYMLGDAPQGKWAQTGEFAAPFATSLMGSGIRAAESPRAMYLRRDIGSGVSKAAGALNKATGPIAGLANMLFGTGRLTDSYVAAKAAPATMRGLGKAASLAAGPLKILADTVNPQRGLIGPGTTLGDMFAGAAVQSAPAANYEQQRGRR